MSDSTDPSQSIAIVGMAALLPGAPDLETFWANTVNGVNASGRLPPVALDAARLGLDIAALQSTPPLHLLALEVTRRALADAPASSSGAWLFLAVPSENGDAASSYVAERLDFAASLATSSPFDGLERARDALRSGACDVAVCAAVDLSDGGRDSSRPEAVVAAVLKRLSDAESDGYRVYGVVSGLGAAPALEDALDRAFADAGVPAASISMLEADTGAVDALQSALHGARPGSITLTSMPPQPGAAVGATGLMSVMRAALALHHRVLPPASGVSAPPPSLSMDGPFVLNTMAMPWPGQQHRAAVSAVEPDGSARAVVLDACDTDIAESGLEQWPAELFVLRGETLDDAYNKVDALLAALAREPAPRLRDLSRSVSPGSTPVQIALVASNLDDLRTKLASTRDTRPASGVWFTRDARVPAGSKLALLFPGQGSQRPGMLRDLFVAFPKLQQHLEAGSAWAGLILPPAAWTDDEKAAQRDRLTDTRVAQPALGVTGMAMADLLLGLGVRPHALGGHSYGELVALCIAGVFSEADLMSLSDARGRCILEATQSSGDPGSMAAVSAGREAVAALIEPFAGAVIANENSPEQTVISGPTASIQAAVAAIKGKGLSAVQLQVACAFHSPIVAPGSVTFREHLDRVEIAPPRLRVFSNTTAQPYPEGAENVRARLAEHIARSVQFVREVEAMYDDGVRIFVEAGPGRVLTGLVGKILGAKPHLALNTDHPAANGLTQVLGVLAQLATNGVGFDVEALYAGRGAVSIDLESRAIDTTTAWVDSSGGRFDVPAAD